MSLVSKLKESFKTTYLGKDIERFYNYHIKIRNEYIQNPHFRKVYTHPLINYEFNEKVLTSAPRALLDGVALLYATGGIIRNDASYIPWVLGAFALGRIIPKSFEGLITDKQRKDTEDISKKIINSAEELRKYEIPFMMNNEDMYENDESDDDDLPGDEWKKG